MPGASIRPIIAIMVTDLPEPDSPTMASTSPFSTVRSRPSTTGTALASPKRTLRFLMFKSGMRISSGGVLEFRVQRIAQAVAHQVDCQHAEQNGQTRQTYHPPGAFDVVASRSQHGAPLRRWRLYAKAEEAQCRGIENGRRGTQGGLNDQRCHAVGQHGDEHQAWQAGTGQARGGHIVAV